MYSSFPVMLNDDKIDEVARKAIKSDSLKKYMTPDDEEDENRAIFGVIHDICDGAFKAFCYKGMSWSDMCEEIAEAVEDMASKEKALRKAYKEACEESEEDDDEDDEETQVISKKE